MIKTILNLASTHHIDLISIATIVIVFIILMLPRIIKSDYWKATVTPLASIVGSGFLIVAPFLWQLVANNGVVIMFMVLAVAYSVGGIIRHNIEFAEPLINKRHNQAALNIHIASDMALSLAYFISILFYLKLLTAFLLHGFGHNSELLQSILTSVILLSTGLYGKLKGFDHLEFLEVFSVSIKLAIIVGIVFALLLFNIETTHFTYHHLVPLKLDLTTFKKLGGMFLVVQGFETSRYLGHKYSQQMRIKTMRFAQILSGLIYLAFIFLSAFLMTDAVQVKETEIIDLMAKISHMLPYVIIVGAMASQYSSSIADLIGCGSIINDLSRKRISLNSAYLIIALVGLVLIWLANIFELVAYASRAFALYYFLQALVALVSNQYKSYKRYVFIAFCTFIGILMLLIFLFGEPL